MGRMSMSEMNEFIENYNKKNMQELKIKDKYTTIKINLGDDDVTIVKYFQAFKQALIGFTFSEDQFKKEIIELADSYGRN